MQPGWSLEVFSTCEAGASSALDPELIPPNQLAWLRNGRIRGGKQHTRPFLRQRLVLPEGLVQGGSYFSVQGGMLIIQIAGRVYRLRIGNRDSDFSSEEIPLEYINSPVLPTAWMEETVGSLVIQDGQSNPIIYDGSTARRSDIAENEVPLGRMMAFVNGRLWVAVGANELVAGDIITSQFQSELKFTETGYFLGGGRFLFPSAITGLSGLPSSGAAGYGALAIFSLEQTYMARADIASRDLWAQMPGFIQALLLSTGSIGQYGIAEVNQDLYWRDGDGGIRSLRSAIADETGGPGIAPISREVSRITDFESVRRLINCSAINFGNRLLMTASPFINQYGKTSFRDVISLDFSPISSMRGKSAPSYDGEWDGILFDILLTGKFDGTKRGFAISTDYDGQNRLWEILDTANQEADMFSGCYGTSQSFDSVVPMIAEYPSRSWGSPSDRKRLQRCDVYLSDIEGDCSLEVYYRPDNYQKWTKWGDTVEFCAKVTDDEGSTPHVWKNLLGQERPQVKTLTIDTEINNLTDFAKQVGFQFQIRTVLRGKAKIHQLNIYAQIINQTQFADRDIADALCRENDVTGNEIDYLMTPGCSMPVGTSTCVLDTNLVPLFEGEWSKLEYPLTVNPDDIMMQGGTDGDNLSVSVPEFGNYVFRLSSNSRTMDYPVEFSCNGRFLLDLTGIPNDGTGLESAISINVYIYTGVSELQLAGSVSYEFFGGVVDLTSMIVSAWSEDSESVVLVRYYQDGGEDLEDPLTPTLTESDGSSLSSKESMQSQFNDALDSVVIDVDDVDESSFTSTVAIPLNTYGPGSMFKANQAETFARIPGIAQYVLSDFTIQFNVKPVSSPAPQNFGRFTDSGPGPRFVTNWQNGNKIAVEPGALGLVSLNNAITLDAWQNVTVKRSGTTETIFVNGVSVRTGSVSSSSLDMGVGAFFYLGGPAETLQGYYSDLRIWNVARSDAEILADYQVRLQGDETGLVAYYPIFETDSFFEDYTDNNIDLVLFTNTTEGVPVPGKIIYSTETPPWFP